MVCKLCLQNKPLADSHIIPKFAGKWLKETSATGYLRTAENPNVRKQDLPTEKLLCYDCEGLLSLWEKAFANEVFLPFLENKKTRFKLERKARQPKSLVSTAQQCGQPTALSGQFFIPAVCPTAARLTPWLSRAATDASR